MSSINPGRYWRSQDELVESPEFIRNQQREFPVDASVLEDPISRRHFIKIMAASMAFAGVTGCSIRKPVQKIKPYAKRPETSPTGQSVFFATTMCTGEEAIGLLVETHEGRPTKIEGNPDHPDSLGATKTYHQASILDLYDPDRFTHPTFRGKQSTWKEFESSIANNLDGDGLVLVTEAQISPTFHRLLTQFQEKYPKAKIIKYDPVNTDNQMQGLHLATDRWIVPVYAIEKANVILSVDSDFLGTEFGSVANTKAFSARRNPNHPNGLNRLYCLESHFTITGGKSEHRFRLKSGDIEGALWLITTALLEQDPTLFRFADDALISVIQKGAVSYRHLLSQKAVDAIARDLSENRGKSLIIVGPSQSDTVHALVHVLNQALGNVDSTLSYQIRPYANYPYQTKTSLAGISELAAELRKKEVKTLIILGGNPVYAAPADLKLSEIIANAKITVHLTQSANETSKECQWNLPRSHYLESWGDATAKNGTRSPIQPLIRPLYDSRSDIELLAMLIGLSANGHTHTRDTWRDMGELEWNRCLHNGIINPANKTGVNAPYRNHHLATKLQEKISKGVTKSGQMELVFKPDAKILDGRFNNNGWLQEMPDPVTKLTWDNAVIVSPATAKRLGVSTQDVVELKNGKQSLVAAVMIVPGSADNSLLISTGFGRTITGRIGENAGFNAFLLRDSSHWDFISNIEVQKTTQTYKLSNTQEHWSMENRHLIREATISQYQQNPDFAKDENEHHHRSSWEEKKYDTGYQWGMSIDLGKCTGCNACVIACQSENNIPIVGKKEVSNGREMHWIRVDRYFEGNENDPAMAYQPVPCLQCENAPCEQVCPVAATVHSEEGLNDMTYNRCVGTRYCSNNCPAKVRRFNFFDYHQRNPQSVKKERIHLFDYFREPAKTVKMAFNPDVTVRMRGVMEKCTFCIQRISKARIHTANNGKVIEDGDVQTACQQACPADAIVFGNILDKKSAVYKLKQDSRDYQILGELHLKARTTFLASIQNPNPAIGSVKG